MKIISTTPVLNHLILHLSDRRVSEKSRLIPDTHSSFRGIDQDQIQVFYSIFILIQAVDSWYSVLLGDLVFYSETFRIMGHIKSL